MVNPLWFHYNHTHAGIAQLVEQLICNQLVEGSSPFAGTIFPFDLRKCLMLFGGAKPLYILAPTATVRRAVNVRSSAAMDADAEGLE